MREAFEKWAIISGFTNQAGLAKHEDQYVLKNTAIAWKIWQAALEASRNDNH